MNSVAINTVVPRNHIQCTGAHFNPLKPNSSKCYTLSPWPNLPFLISNIWALWRSALSARMPKC